MPALAQTTKSTIAERICLREIVEQLGGTVVGINFVIDLTFLGGRERLGEYDLHALISY